MERREVLKLVALTALSPKLNALQAAVACHMEEAAKKSAEPDYKLQFFSEQESRQLDQVIQKNIPAHSHSPGAHSVKTHLFADLMVATDDDSVKKIWRDGIRLLQQEAASSTPADALKKAAMNEGNPGTELERFFTPLKEMTINGYYTSSAAIHQDLHYLGNTYLTAFPGCTHPEHQK